MVGLFLVAAVVTVAAVPPALALGGAGRGRPAHQPTASVCSVAMAAPRSTSSSERTTGRTGEPMTRRHAPVSSGSPGRIRVAALTDGTLQESEGDGALARLPDLLGDRGTTLWVDLADPSPEQVEAVGAALGLHPLILEDVLEGNQRAKIESTDGVVHLVLFALTHGKRFVASEIDLVLGLGYLLTRARRGLGPAHDPPPPDRPGGHHGPRPGPPALGDLR